MTFKEAQKLAVQISKYLDRKLIRKERRLFASQILEHRQAGLDAVKNINKAKKKHHENTHA